MLKKSLLLAIATLLVGCQHPAPSAPVHTIAAQIDQVANVLASARFLRNACQRSDILTEQPLQQRLLQEARRRGWNSGAKQWALLPQKSEERYQALQGDSLPVTQKCQRLNQSTGAILRALS